jgi:predicted Zn-dependent protease
VADLVGLELGARAGFAPQAAVSLWQKMGREAGDGSGLAFLSTHPNGPDRLRRLEENIPRVEPLYRQALARR